MWGLLESRECGDRDVGAAGIPGMLQVLFGIARGGDGAGHIRERGLAIGPVRAAGPVLVPIPEHSQGLLERDFVTGPVRAAGSASHP